ncbi:MAG: hypothetical protein LBP62_03175 [Clostridiales bacterium]|jgi:aromatic ring hydroxylase|nr:hypothetical protein [Clostridiales bacterium]
MPKISKEDYLTELKKNNEDAAVALKNIVDPETRKKLREWIHETSALIKLLESPAIADIKITVKTKKRREKNVSKN